MAVSRYSNRYAEIESSNGRDWIVYNLVSGMPVYADEGKIRIYPSYTEARQEMVGIFHYYQSLEKGRM